MQVTNTIEKTRELVNNWKKEGKTIGLVPTMGYLHEGCLLYTSDAADEL